MGPGKLRGEGEGLLEGSDGPLQVSFVLQHIAKVVINRDGSRSRRQRRSVIAHRLVPPRTLLQGMGQIEVQPEIPWPAPLAPLPQLQPRAAQLFQAGTDNHQQRRRQALEVSLPGQLR
jgi:hypothetical protein